jgi:hypothetical protein
VAPVIAAINGATIGGGLEFAMACDIRIASTDASFVAAGVNVGLIANFWRLARITGLGPAKEILLTGDRYTAEQALTWAWSPRCTHRMPSSRRALQVENFLWRCSAPRTARRPWPPSSTSGSATTGGAHRISLPGGPHAMTGPARSGASRASSPDVDPAPSRLSMW